MALVKIVVKFVLVLMIAVLSAEIYFRIFDKDLKLYAFQNKILERTWARPKENLQMPPFNLVSNLDWDKESRLEEVYRYSSLPPSSDYVATDFLRVKHIPYNIHINSLGYRGREVPAKKNPNTYRVISLGSYMTFGHGVNDNETYSAVAESILNLRSKKIQFEILNGGMETGSLILGLSRLHFEAEKLKPDAVVLEYGFIDVLGLYVDFIPQRYFELRGVPEPKGSEYLLITELRQRTFNKRLFHFIMHSPLADSFAVNAYVKNVMGRSIEMVNPEVEVFKEALTETCKSLVKKGIKVILVEFPPLESMSPDFFKDIAKEAGAEFLDGKQVFAENPPDENALKDFEENGFLTEIGVSCQVQNCKELYKKYGPYMQNVFQLSPAGQQVIGKALAEKIELITSNRK